MWHFRFNGPTPEALVKGRENIYFAVMAPSEGSIEEPLTVLSELKRQGLIRHIGVSNVSPEQLAEARRITEIVCVQNLIARDRRNRHYKRCAAYDTCSSIHTCGKADGAQIIPFF